MGTGERRTETAGGRRRINRPAAASNPREVEELDDRQAVEMARNGDHEAFRVLVERYQGRVFRLALRVLRDEEQARDATQEAFLKVYGALRRFEGRSSFYTWLYRLVMNLCLDLRRKDKSGRQVEWEEERSAEVSEDAGPLSGPEQGPALDLERRELRDQLAAAIESLPDEARQTLMLREVDGLSYAEIAQAMGIPKGTVMSRLHHARRKVQQKLLESGVAAPGGSKEGEP